jgi:hypothetical protein
LGANQKVSGFDQLVGKDSTQFIQGGALAHSGAVAVDPGAFLTVLQTPELRIVYSFSGYGKVEQLAYSLSKRGS